MTKGGLKADLTKFEAKMERSAVHRLIGQAKYLCKFLQGLALRRLTLKNAEWNWTPRSCDSFDQSV